MRKESIKTESLIIRPEAVSDKSRTSGGHSLRTLRCVNLRPVAGADGRTVLQSVGRPSHLSTSQLECVGVLSCSDGGEALLLWREPELWVLRPGDTEPEVLGNIGGSLYNATLCGNRLIVNCSEGLWQVELSDGKAVLSRVPVCEDFHGISLRAAHCTILRSTVASRKLQREYQPGETVVDGSDARRLGSDLGEAYEQLCAAARGQGCFVQPLLARYRVYDSRMNELYCSAPVLLSHPDGVQCADTNYLRSLDRRKVESYELTAQTWRIELDVPAGLPPEAAYVTVYVTAQFHPYAPTAGCAVALSRSEGSGNEFGHIVLPGQAPAEALLRRSIGCIPSLERPIGTFGIGSAARTVTIESGSPDDVRSEIKAIGKAWKHSVAEPDELLRRLSPPNIFTGRCGCAGPAAVLWGGLRSRRYKGYPLGQFAAQTAAMAWQGWIKVNFADGTSVLWSGGGDSGAPTRLNPVLSYPSSDAVNMVIGLKINGEPAHEQAFTLSSDPASGAAVYIHSSLMPFELQSTEDGQTVAPFVKTVWTDYPDTLLLASVSAPMNPCTVCNPGNGGINALAAAGGSQSAWDFGRARFYAFCRQPYYLPSRPRVAATHSRQRHQHYNFGSTSEL